MTLLEQALCPHEHWIYDDSGNHWCRKCYLWHDFPHEDGQDWDACVETVVEA